MSFFYFTIFFFGLAAGSFLNSVIHRLYTGESFLLQRSYCPYCKHVLSWQDLIPLFSFVLLRGKCRYCREKISFQYPLVEFATGGFFTLAAHRVFSQPEIFPCALLFCALTLLFYWFSLGVLLIIFVYDFKHFIIPDRVVYPAIGIALLYHILSGAFHQWSWQDFLNPLSAALLASSFFLAIVLISRGRWMGSGDPKLAFFMGLLLGFPNIFVALFFAFFTGAIIGIGLIVFGKKSLKSEIPFGPFLVAGTLLAMFCGKDLINWYLDLFL